MSWANVAIIAASAIGAGSSIYGASQAGKGAQSGGTGLAVMPQYSFTEPRLRLTSDYLSDNITRMSQGEFPAYWDKLSPVVKQGMQRDLSQTYFGGPGMGPGLLDQARSLGAMTGIGPQATNRRVSSALDEYANKKKSIDEYLAGLGIQIMDRASTAFPALAAQMPTGPNSQMYQWGGQAGYQPDMSGMNAAGQTLGMWGLFNQNRGTATAPVAMTGTGGAPWVSPYQHTGSGTINPSTISVSSY